MHDEHPRSTVTLKASLIAPLANSFSSMVIHTVSCANPHSIFPSLMCSLFMLASNVLKYSGSLGIVLPLCANPRTLSGIWNLAFAFAPCWTCGLLFAVALCWTYGLLFAVAPCWTCGLLPSPPNCLILNIIKSADSYQCEY